MFLKVAKTTPFQSLEKQLRMLYYHVEIFNEQKAIVVATPHTLYTHLIAANFLAAPLQAEVGGPFHTNKTHQVVPYKT